MAVSADAPGTVDVPDASPAVAASTLVVKFNGNNGALTTGLDTTNHGIIITRTDTGVCNNAYVGVKYLPSGSLVLSTRRTQQSNTGDAPRAHRTTFRTTVRRGHHIASVLHSGGCRGLTSRSGVAMVANHTRFANPRDIRVTATRNPITIATDGVFVGANTAPHVPSVPNVHAAPNICADAKLVSLSSVPRQLIVVNSKFVKLRFTSVFTSFNASIAILRRGTRFLPHRSTSITTTVHTRLRTRNIGFLFGTSAGTVTPTTSNNIELSITIGNVAHNTSRTYSSAPTNAKGTRASVANTANAASATAAADPADGPASRTAVSRIRAGPSSSNRPQFTRPTRTQFYLAASTMLITAKHAPGIRKLRLRTTNIRLARHNTIGISRLLHAATTSV